MEISEQSEQEKIIDILQDILNLTESEQIKTYLKTPKVFESDFINDKIKYLLMCYKFQIQSHLARIEFMEKFIEKYSYLNDSRATPLSGATTQGG